MSSFIPIWWTNLWMNEKSLWWWHLSKLTRFCSHHEWADMFLSNLSCNVQGRARTGIASTLLTEYNCTVVLLFCYCTVQFQRRRWQWVKRQDWVRLIEHRNWMRTPNASTSAWSCPTTNSRSTHLRSCIVKFQCSSWDHAHRKAISALYPSGMFIFPPALNDLMFALTLVCFVLLHCLLGCFVRLLSSLTLRCFVTITGFLGSSRTITILFADQSTCYQTSGIGCRQFEDNWSIQEGTNQVFQNLSLGPRPKSEAIPLDVPCWSQWLRSDDPWCLAQDQEWAGPYPHLS